MEALEHNSLTFYPSTQVKTYFLGSDQLFLFIFQIDKMYDQANETEIMSWDIPAEIEFYYSPIFGTDLAMPEWEAIITLVFLSAVILTTIVGNILVSLLIFVRIKCM